MTHTVLASTAAGCDATGITTSFMPGRWEYGNLNIAVFNRWGQRVFYTADPAVGWNGSTEGQIVSVTTPFVWMAAGIDYQGSLVERKATVILVR